MIKIILSLTIFILFLTACGQGNAVDSNSDGSTDNNLSDNLGDIEEGEEAVVEYDGLEYTMTIEQSESSFTIYMVLTNVSDQTKQIEFSSGHQFDVVIEDEEGNMLYDFAEDKMFTQAIISEELSAGDELTFTDEWNSDEPFTSGNIATKLYIYSIDGQSLSDHPFQLDKTWSKETE
ncbi:BsuPI-related putative proteinase inhibitor [Salipaludibacillus sp. HK11]|uniref:BsuPI-related putative proteinase inhibitor n=1 Tax=Salipaludibacillus sp. HK11 TaxID=3394320 RepID=UPI0039FD3701